MTQRRPPRREGLFAGGRCGYPSHHLTGGALSVVYSISKEDTAVMRAPPKAIA